MNSATLRERIEHARNMQYAHLQLHELERLCFELHRENQQQHKDVESLVQDSRAAAVSLSKLDQEQQAARVEINRLEQLLANSTSRCRSLETELDATKVVTLDVSSLKISVVNYLVTQLNTEKSLCNVQRLLDRISQMLGCVLTDSQVKSVMEKRAAVREEDQWMVIANQLQLGFSDETFMRHILGQEQRKVLRLVKDSKLLCTVDDYTESEHASRSRKD